MALGYIRATLGSYRWLRPSGRCTAKEIASEFSTALLCGLIRDESVRTAVSAGAVRPNQFNLGGLRYRNRFPGLPRSTDSAVICG